MTDLNEKLKLVAEYDGVPIYRTEVEFTGSRKEIKVPIRWKYDSDYNQQIPVWQKVCKEAQPKFSSFMNFDFIKIEQKYYRALKYNTPLESFEILVTAIQFINNLKQK